MLRVELTGDPSLADLLAQVRKRSLAAYENAYENQDVPFEVLVERLNPARSLTHQPLIQVMLAWQNFAGNGDAFADLTLGDLTVTQMRAETHTARMDLLSNLAGRFGDSGQPDGICGVVEFRTDVFEPESIQTLVERFEQVLTTLTRRLSTIEVLDADDRNQNTSGNTGVAQGVAITHRNVTQLLESLDVDMLRWGVWTQCHSLAFDVSVCEMWGALFPADGWSWFRSRRLAHQRLSMHSWSRSASPS